MLEGVAALKKQAAQTLEALEKEIAKKEKELATFREEADICLQVLGKPTSQVSAGGGSGKRINWVEILGSLPKKFTAKEVIAKINKPPAAAYTQLYQMTKAGRLNRTKTGYEKV